MGIKSYEAGGPRRRSLRWVEPVAARKLRWVELGSSHSSGVGGPRRRGLRGAEP